MDREIPENSPRPELRQKERVAPWVLWAQQKKAAGHSGTHKVPQKVLTVFSNLMGKKIPRHIFISDK